jgi:hypothetical protein
MQEIEVAKELIKSPQYKNLMKCSEKTCKDYTKVLLKEIELTNTLVKLQKDLKKIKDFKEIVKRSKEVLIVTKELTQLNADKKALLCILNTCKNEYAEVFTLKSKKMVGAIDSKIKMMK